MMDYYGVDLLKAIRDAYAPRCELAQERGYAVEGNKYYWLYEELHYRMQVIRQAMLFLDALPQFLCQTDEDKHLQYVVGYASSFFTQDKMGGAERDEQGGHPIFNDGNPYWVDVQEAMDHFDKNYDLKNLPLLYIDSCELVVRMIRLHLFVREKCYHAIDREKFDSLMGLRRDRVSAIA